MTLQIVPCIWRLQLLNFHLPLEWWLEVLDILFFRSQLIAPVWGGGNVSKITSHNNEKQTNEQRSHIICSLLSSAWKSENWPSFWLKNVFPTTKFVIFLYCCCHLVLKLYSIIVLCVSYLHTERGWSRFPQGRK